MMKRYLVFAPLVIVLTIGLSLSAVFAGDNPKTRSKRGSEKIKITVNPVGPTQAIIDAATARVAKSDSVLSVLENHKYRVMSFEYLDAGAQLPTRFREVIYDYTADKTLVAEGDLAGTGPIVVHQDSFQPIPTEEEFAEAVSILAADSRFSSFFRENTVKPFRPMPDVTVLDGTVERLVNVGLDSLGSSARNEVVSVNLRRGTVLRYDGGAPPTSNAAPEACGLANAGQSTTARNTAGQYQMTVTQGPTTLWEMLIIRPAASSGTRASGIEVRDVKFKGKSVLKRGHVPVLNVKYGSDECGPYRDWQYQEGQFATPASGNTDPAPGIRIVAANQVATTALDGGTDTGNFRGVAIYTQGTDTVLVTELEAGWYRYIMEWRFNNDGTIRPRYGFGATDNSCVCFSHTHHAYWRFDFDIVQPNNNVYQMERGRRFLKPIATEAKFTRNYQTNKSILIQNSAGDEAYLLRPNVSDGLPNSSTDTFPSGDFWVLKYKEVIGGSALQNELDDGFNQTTSANSFIQIDPFVNGESVANTDVVVWYGASFIHNDAGNLTLNPDRTGMVITGSHVFGPDIRPVRW